MRGTLAVALRELAERRAVLAAAAVAGLTAFAAPLVPGVRVASSAEARDTMAFAVAFGLCLVVALMTGASLAARDFSERRLSFDLARPLGGAAIWAGRFIAALALCGLVAVFVLAPATLVGGGLFTPPGESTTFLRRLVVGVLALVPLAHVASIALRSRSRWLVFDLAAIVATAALAVSTSFRFMTAVAPSTHGLWVIALAAGAVGALWAATATQVIGGRSDLRRGHRLQSLVFGTSLIALALAGEGYSRWMVAVEPGDLSWIADGRAAPRGDWLVLSGPAERRPPDFQPLFLVDPRTGAHLGVPPLSERSLVFSADGSRAAWLERTGGCCANVVVADLGPAPEVSDTPIVVVAGRLPTLALSSDGSRLALVEGNRLDVHEVATGRFLATGDLATKPTAGVEADIDFRSDDVVRVYLRGRTLEIGELDVRSRRLQWLASSPRSISWSGGHDRVFAPTSPRSLSWTAGHDRLLAFDTDRSELLDGTSGAVIARFDFRESARLLADGRVVLVPRESAPAARMRVVSRDGVEERAFDLEERAAALGHELMPGFLLVTGAGRPGELAVVDVDRGTTRAIGRGNLPLDASGRCPEPGSPATRLVMLLPEYAVGLVTPAGDRVEQILPRE